MAPVDGVNASARALALVNLDALMQRYTGSPEVAIGLIDGPVALDHPDLVSEHIRPLDTNAAGSGSGAACGHGTFVAGILIARRGTPAPAICPDCMVLTRPIFGETASDGLSVPAATPDELGAAIVACVDAGARVVNISAALTASWVKIETALEGAFDYAMRRGTLVVAAAGNQGALGSSPITRHPWVIPVTACNLLGQLLPFANFGDSIGRLGLCAPGLVASLSLSGPCDTQSGTSIAAPLVAGAIALLWSIFPTASASTIKSAVVPSIGQRRRSLVPPLLDARKAYQMLLIADGVAA